MADAPHKTTTHDTTLSVSALLGHPGTSRTVSLALPVPDGFRFPLATVAAPIGLDGQLESVVAGILLRGQLRAQVVSECARCLTPVRSDLEVPVVELFADPARAEPDDDEIEAGYLISEETIDVDTLLRDALATALPSRPLCTPDCRGLCAHCGADRNQGDCGCRDDEADPRWAPLEGLRLPE